MLTRSLYLAEKNGPFAIVAADPCSKIDLFEIHNISFTISTAAAVLGRFDPRPSGIAVL
jgi:hypothetical protein